MTVAYELRTSRTAKYLPLDSLVDYVDDPTDAQTILLGSFLRSARIEPIEPPFSQPYKAHVTYTAPIDYSESTPSRIVLTAKRREYLEVAPHISWQQWEAALSRLTTATVDFSSAMPVNELLLSTSSNSTNLAIGLLLAASAAWTSKFDPPEDVLAGFDKYETPDWDGYGAEPISQETLDAARHFVSLLPKTLGDPEIAPGADGTVGLEWVLRNGPLRKLFIDIGPGGIWTAYWRRESGEKATLPHQRINDQTREHLVTLFSNLSM